MERHTGTRIKSLATTTTTISIMIAALYLSRCWSVQSLQLLPSHRSFGVLFSRHSHYNPPFQHSACSFTQQWTTRSIASSATSTSVSSSLSMTADAAALASSSTATQPEEESLSEDDRNFLQTALEHARIGKGHTFPNPAVGCLLVRQDTSTVLGAGFHPRAGFPHAEIFALLEAAGHLSSGVASATSLVKGTSDNDNDDDADDDLALRKLVDTYIEEGGPESLFGDALSEIPVTAYVTLEPCCHYGKTPPCAFSLKLAGVDRVVVGFRDPNPRVDGGGVKVLQEAGIPVDMAHDDGCAEIVDSFVKRILPKDYDATGYSHVTGSMRRGLRKLAGQKKAEQSLPQVGWSGKTKVKTEDAVEMLEISPEWMEHLDDLLWREELVNLRLNKAVGKKKLAKQLGHRVASLLGAHVAQVVGHTVLLYRPAMPSPILDLEDLASEEDNNNEKEEEDK